MSLVYFYDKKNKQRILILVHILFILSIINTKLDGCFLLVDIPSYPKIHYGFFCVFIYLNQLYRIWLSMSSSIVFAQINKAIIFGGIYINNWIHQVCTYFKMSSAFTVNWSMLEG